MKVRKKGGGGSPGAGAEIPLQSMLKTMVMQIVPLCNPWRTTVEQSVTLQPVEDLTLEQMYVP